MTAVRMWVVCADQPFTPHSWTITNRHIPTEVGHPILIDWNSFFIVLLFFFRSSAGFLFLVALFRSLTTFTKNSVLIINFYVISGVECQLCANNTIHRKRLRFDWIKWFEWHTEIMQIDSIPIQKWDWWTDVILKNEIIYVKCANFFFLLWYLPMTITNQLFRQQLNIWFNFQFDLYQHT